MITTTSMGETLERAHEVGEIRRTDAFVRRVELRERPPAMAPHVLGGEVDRRGGIELVDTHEVDAVALLEQPPVRGKRVGVLADEPAEFEVAQAELLGELAAQPRLVALALEQPAAGSDPPRACVSLPLQQQNATARVDDEGANGLARLGLEPGAQGAKPAQPLLVRHCGIRRRRRRQHEEPRVVERAQLRTELRAPAERTTDSHLSYDWDGACKQVAL